MTHEDVGFDDLGGAKVHTSISGKLMFCMQFQILALIAVTFLDLCVGKAAKNLNSSKFFYFFFKFMKKNRCKMITIVPSIMSQTTYIYQ